MLENGTYKAQFQPPILVGAVVVKGVDTRCQNAVPKTPKNVLIELTGTVFYELNDLFFKSEK